MSTTSPPTCGTPPAITGGTVITSGPYTNDTTAVYQCSTGYLMAGSSYTTCLNGVWDTSPTCTLQDMNNVNVGITNNYDNDFPSWLIYIIAAVIILLVLLLLTCLLVWCCQLLGCFGAGGMFGDHQPKGCMLCCRKKSDSYQTRERTCKTSPRRYVYDEEGRRFHIDDLGRRCYYNHNNKAMPEYPTDTTSPRTTFVKAVNEVMVEKRQMPAKEIQAWKPHSNSIRSINTSTK